MPFSLAHGRPGRHHRDCGELRKSDPESRVQNVCTEGAGEKGDRKIAETEIKSLSVPGYFVYTALCRTAFDRLNVTIIFLEERFPADNY